MDNDSNVCITPSCLLIKFFLFADQQSINQNIDGIYLAVAFAVDHSRLNIIPI